jgi:heme o synthase
MINYYLLIKPGIIMGNLVTFAAGFLLASRGQMDIFLFLAALIGLGFVMASGCVFNNYIDRHHDQKMARTKNRALVTGAISLRNALIFGAALAFVGNLILFSFVNLLTLLLADTGFFVYVVLYSLWKSRTIYGTAIGSVAGAIPPVVGYCAVSNSFDGGALIFFAMMVLWQMPHFFAIALMHLKDYTAAGIPLLPVEKGVLRTKIHMALYIVAFIGTATLLTLFNYTGRLYLVVAVAAGLGWLWLSMSGFKREDVQRWGTQMFRLSLVVIGAISLVIFIDTV